MSILKDLSYYDLKAIIALEQKAHKWQEDECNYNIAENTISKRDNIIHKEIKRIFGQEPTGFIVNGDPRGCTLKIDPQKGGDVTGLVTDWGGYGMLALSANEELKNWAS